MRPSWIDSVLVLLLRVMMFSLLPVSVLNLVMIVRRW